ncbi:hypothetical protein [Kitasatospora terrestris]
MRVDQDLAAPSAGRDQVAAAVSGRSDGQQRARVGGGDSEDDEFGAGSSG